MCRTTRELLCSRSARPQKALAGRPQLELPGRPANGEDARARGARVDARSGVRLDAPAKGKGGQEKEWLLNNPAAEHPVAVVKDGRLSRAQRALRGVEAHQHCLIIVGK